MRILLAEDERSLSRAVIALLEKNNYSADAVYDGAETLEYLAAENYDVVSRRYENGMALVTDLTDAANMKLDAELALENARINLVYCLYHLKYQAGTE